MKNKLKNYLKNQEKYSYNFNNFFKHFKYTLNDLFFINFFILKNKILENNKSILERTFAMYANKDDKNIISKEKF